MDFPHVFVSDAADEESAAGELAAQVAEHAIHEPFLIASPHADALIRVVAKGRSVERLGPSADQHWAAEAGRRAKRAGADAIVAAGGGRLLDVAKLAAARAGLPVFVAPTQLSHDGICSPVAVVPDESGFCASLGALAPRAVFVSLPTIAGAPVSSVAAGVGDLLANPLALRDWALAAEHGLEEIDQRAWDLSVEAFNKIEPELAGGLRPGDLEFLRRLADALVLSGMAMIVAGTSRPASGGEHEISHAIEEIFGGRAHHGAQVAFGCIFTTALYDEDVDAFRTQLTRLGLPDHPKDLELDEDDLVQIVLRAPETRPGRFTIIEEADMDEAAARALVKRIWG